MTAEVTHGTDRLRQLLRLLDENGRDPVVGAHAALALASDIPLNDYQPLVIYVRQREVSIDSSDLTTMAATSDETVVGQTAAVPADLLAELSAELRMCADPLKEAQTAAAQLQLRAWTLIWSSAGIVEMLPGVRDEIANGRLRLKDAPHNALRHDADKLLELSVWAALTGLKPTGDLLRQARRNAGHVLGLDRKLWCSRFASLLTAWRSSVGLQFLQDARILPLMVPEVSAMVDFHKSCPVHHKDIWDHTLQVVDKCPPVLAVRWTALMHDVGKVWTRTVGKRGKVHFLRHEELGGSLMEGVAGRFHMDAALRDRVVYVISNHARANVYATDWTDSAVRRLIRDMGEHLTDVIAFSRSDYTTKRAWRIKEVRALGHELVRRIEDVRSLDAQVAPLPKGFGNLVMTTTGRSGGRWLGAVQRWLEAEVEAGRIEPGLEAERYLVHVKTHDPALLIAD